MAIPSAVSSAKYLPTFFFLSITTWIWRKQNGQTHMIRVSFCSRSRSQLFWCLQKIKIANSFHNERINIGTPKRRQKLSIKKLRNPSGIEQNKKTCSLFLSRFLNAKLEDCLCLILLPSIALLHLKVLFLLIFFKKCGLFGIRCLVAVSLSS